MSIALTDARGWWIAESIISMQWTARIAKSMTRNIKVCCHNCMCIVCGVRWISSTYESNNRAIDQSINQSFIQSVKQSFNRPDSADRRSINSDQIQSDNQMLCRRRFVDAVSFNSSACYIVEKKILKITWFALTQTSSQCEWEFCKKFILEGPLFHLSSIFIHLDLRNVIAKMGHDIRHRLLMTQFP